MALIFVVCNKTALSFEAFPQPKGMLFLNPYVNYNWHNNPMGGGRYNKRDKVSSVWAGMFAEYGLTERITLGADVFFAETFTHKNGRITGKIADKAFALQQVNLFARYAIVNEKNFSISLYTDVFTPSFGKGSGRLDTYGDYSQWKHGFGIEFGYRFNPENSITFNLKYRAQYNSMPSRDIMEMKLTYVHKFTHRWLKDWMFYGYIKKQAYINKGKRLYGFAQGGKFNMDAFNFISNNGYTAIDLFMARKLAPGKFIVFAYTHSLHGKWLGNKGMNYDFRAFWLEFWLFLK